MRNAAANGSEEIQLILLEAAAIWFAIRHASLSKDGELLINT